MYIPKLFRNEDFPQVQQFLRDNPFALVVSRQVQGAPLATHLPISLEQNAAGEAVLTGHFAKANPQWRTLEDHPVLVVFSGTHHYISSAWYGHQNVPTWNYIAVHISGRARLHSPAEAAEAIARMMERYEPAAHSPASLDKLAPAVVERELRGIVGFEVLVENIEAAYKLSQNRNAADFANILAELEKLKTTDAAQMAAVMAQHKPHAGQ